jgi:hypothetical protein
MSDSIKGGALPVEAKASRRLILAAGSAAAVFATVKSASAGGEMPDFQLLEIARQLDQLQPAYAVAGREEGRLIRIYEANRPERPIEMNVDHRDALGVDFDRKRLPDGKWRLRYTSQGVAELRESPRALQKFIGTQAQWDATVAYDSALYALVLDPPRQARAEEVIAACEAWEAECEAYGRSIGLTEAQRIATEFSERDDALYDALLAIPAGSLAGLAAQAAAVRFRGADDEGKIVDAVVRLAQEGGR